MRGADMESGRGPIALQGQVGDDHSQVPAPLEQLAPRSVDQGGRQRRRLDQAVDLERCSPAHGAVGAGEVLCQLLADARGDIIGQTGGSDGAQDHLSLRAVLTGVGSLLSHHGGRPTVCEGGR
jgi:hypothetical protein